MAGSKKPQQITESHTFQIKLLRVLSGDGAASRSLAINELVSLSGLPDEKEVQRYLYILEGQKLVSPFPEGDFTSKTWRVTKEGLRAWKLISRSITAQ